MEEFWVCQNCKSLNRAGSNKCYSCRTKFGTRAPEPSPVSRNAPPPPPVSLGAAPDFGATAQASQHARLGSFGPAAAGGGIAAAPRSSAGFPNPVSAVKRRIASSLSVRQSVSVTALGYVTAALLVLLLAFGALLLLTLLPVAADLLQHGDAGVAWAQLSAGQQGLAVTITIAMLVVGAVAWMLFSVFVGLTTHNATGLGADQPLLSPYLAGTCWGRLLFTQARIFVGLVVPVALIWQDYVIPGLLAGIVVVEIAHRNLDDPSSWLSRPARHLPDLYIKLGVQGTITSRLAALWSASFRVANILAILLAALPAVALSAFAVASLSGHQDLVAWQSDGLGPWQLVTVVLAGSVIGWTVAAVALLVPITIGFVDRQRVRRTLVRVGRSRSWLARPGEGGYTPGPSTLAADGDLDEDRIVERLPRYAPSQAAGPGFGSPDSGSAGFGDQTPNGPGHDDSGFGRSGYGGGFGGGFGGSAPGGPESGRPDRGTPDQASLNSPSTTSSFPWSSGPWSAEPPSDPD